MRVYGPGTFCFETVLERPPTIAFKSPRGSGAPPARLVWPHWSWSDSPAVALRIQLPHRIAQGLPVLPP